MNLWFIQLTSASGSPMVVLYDIHNVGHSVAESNVVVMMGVMMMPRAG